jgi:DNA-directed RNA polymerase specialized sigma24 family protein
MTKSDFEQWYKDNYEDFIFYKARWIIGNAGKSYQDINDLIHNTFEILYNKIDSIEEKFVRETWFLTMRNTFFNMYYTGWYNNNVCCCGDLGKSDYGYNNPEEVQIKQEIVVEEEKVISKSQAKNLRKLRRLSKADRKIIETYSELKTFGKVSKNLGIPYHKVRLVVNKFFKNKKPKKLCSVCSKDHFCKGYCRNHYFANYQRKKRDG